MSKILHAAEGFQEQTQQQAEIMKTAAYAAKSLAGNEEILREGFTKVSIFHQGVGKEGKLSY